MAEPALLLPFPAHSGPFTAADRAALPDDGRRYELLDGALLVSPSPGRAHNDLVMHLFRLLDRACPPDVTIYPVPFDYRLADGSELVPDITVAHTADLGRERLTRTPLLVVEVLSASSRLIDPLVKRAKYQAAAVPAFWIGDPQALRLTVLELEGDAYRERAILRAGDRVALDRPFPVEIEMPVVKRR